MGVDELTPQPTGQILVTNNGTVVMSFGTLVRISNGDVPVMPLEKVKNGLGLKESKARLGEVIETLSNANAHREAR